MAAANRAQVSPLVAGPGVARRHPAQRGFSLVELMIVMSAMLPLLATIVMATGTLGKTATANDRAADVRETCRRIINRVELLLRPGKLSSLQVRATAADVTAARATTVGEWIGPIDDDPRDHLRFVAAKGLLSMNAKLSTLPREFGFLLDGGETMNGKDDDGDGMIDEGSLRLVYGNSIQLIARNLELCRFTVRGRLVIVTMRAAAADRTGRVHRATLSQTMYLRNN